MLYIRSVKVHVCISGGGLKGWALLEPVKLQLSVVSQAASKGLFVTRSSGKSGKSFPIIKVSKQRTIEN